MNPGSSGSNLARFTVRPWALTLVMVVPWYERSRNMTMYLVPLPLLRQYCRAILTAVSTDSPPPSVRNTWLRSPGMCSATLAASLRAGSLAIWKMW